MYSMLALSQCYLVHDLAAKCEACRHVQRLDVWELAQRIGWDTTLAELERRLKCSRCGARPASLAVTKARAWRGR